MTHSSKTCQACAHFPAFTYTSTYSCRYLFANTYCTTLPWRFVWKKTLFSWTCVICTWKCTYLDKQKQCIFSYMFSFVAFRHVQTVGEVNIRRFFGPTLVSVSNRVFPAEEWTMLPKQPKVTELTNRKKHEKDMPGDSDFALRHIKCHFFQILFSFMCTSSTHSCQIRRLHQRYYKIKWKSNPF